MVASFFDGARARQNPFECTVVKFAIGGGVLEFGEFFW